MSTPRDKTIESHLPGHGTSRSLIDPRARTRVETFVSGRIPGIVAAPGGHVTLLRLDGDGETQVGRWNASESGAAPAVPFHRWLPELILTLAAAVLVGAKLKLRLRGWLDGRRAHGSCTFTVHGAGAAPPCPATPAPDADRPAGSAAVDASADAPARAAPVAPPPDPAPCPSCRTQQERIRDLERDLDEERARRRTRDHALGQANRSLDRRDREVRDLAERIARHDSAHSDLKAILRDERRERRSEGRRHDAESRELGKELNRVRAHADRLEETLATTRRDLRAATKTAAKARHERDELAIDRDEWSDLADDAFRTAAKITGYDPDDFDDDDDDE
jgi:hypothetical protein